MLMPPLSTGRQALEAIRRCYKQRHFAMATSASLGQITPKAAQLQSRQLTVLLRLAEHHERGLPLVLPADKYTFSAADLHRALSDVQDWLRQQGDAGRAEALAVMARWIDLTFPPDDAGDLPPGDAADTPADHD